jgi:cephalosporin hydroxylase
MRKPESKIPKDALRSIQEGTLNYRYKGISCQKNPFDLALYLKLLYEEKPRTIIEIGSFSGGSALWLADTLRRYNVKSHIYSVDLNPVSSIEDEMITFLPGNALNLSNSFSCDFMASIPRPLLVIEDSAHTYEVTLAVLNFFDNYLVPGEYIVIEDGIVNDLVDSIYRKYDNGPNKAIFSFLENTKSMYMIDAEYCDYYGHNFTYNTNGYLKKML